MFKRAGVFVCAWLLFVVPATTDVTAAAGPMPPALKALQAFRGRVTYQARALDEKTQTNPVLGALTVPGPRWILDERGAHGWLHVSPDGSAIHTGGQTFAFDDPFEVEELSNAWAPVLADLAATGPNLTARGQAWLTGAGLAVYLQPDGSDVSGVVDTRSAQAIAYSFGDWTTVSGLRLPQTILRLRAGVSDRSYSITDYAVTWTPVSSNDAPAPPRVDRPASQIAPQPANVAGGSLVWRWFGTVFGLLLIGLLAAAWLRRDALTDRVCRALAFDPRGWRDEGSTLFVTPDGSLTFEGQRYRVGAVFYNRVTRVQSSPLFVRVSADGVPHALVLARKFGLPFAARPSSRVGTRAVRAGFSLIESLVATALFAAVVVAAVLPAMVVLGGADRLAAQRQAALRVASNALVDEQAALAYGTISDGARTQVADGLTTAVSVTPTAFAGVHSVAINVSDAQGRSLVRIVTMIGPAVPPPATGSPAPGTGQ